MFGATSFVGVIHVSYSCRRERQQLSVAGEPLQRGGSLSTALPLIDPTAIPCFLMVTHAPQRRDQGLTVHTAYRAAAPLLAARREWTRVSGADAAATSPVLREGPR